MSSPGCANFGLKKAADFGEEKFGTEAARFVREDFYVDDDLTSQPTATDAIYLVCNTKQLCTEYGIKLHKFASNSHKVLEAIPPNEGAKFLGNITFDSNDQNHANERVLGIEWHIAPGYFQFKITIRKRPEYCLQSVKYTTPKVVHVRSYWLEDKNYKTPARNN